MGLGVESLDREGRIIPLEYQAFYMINAYSPTRRTARNAGPTALSGMGSVPDLHSETLPGSVLSSGQSRIYLSYYC